MRDRLDRASRSVRDGGDRIARIARWLARNPGPAASALQLLVTIGDDTDILQIWPRADVTEQLAHEINDLIVATANEERCQIRARTQWVTGDMPPMPLVSQSYVCNPEDPSLSAQLDGTAKSLVVQSQRGWEAATRFLLQRCDSDQQSWERLNDRLLTELARRDQEKLDLIAENASLKAQLSEYQDLTRQALEAAESAKESSGRSRFERYAEIFGPLLERKLMGAAAGLMQPPPQAPPSPPSQTS